MAHFAELDSNNKVIRVSVISNDDVDANGGDLSAGAENFVATLHPHKTAEESISGVAGASWKQCSYNRTFRRWYPCRKTWNYDPTLDMFYPDAPHPSWSRDANGDWDSPISRPTETSNKTCTWDEDNLKWKGTDLTNDSEYHWNNDTDSWDSI